jgi:DNA invertase Pin-like site-specific DNA recombinase
VKTAFSYLRVSGRGQIRKGGFPRQRDAIAEYAKANRIRILAEFRDEGVSGTKELQDRDGLADLMAKLQTNGPVDLVLVENASRLARDLMVGEIILRELAKRGAKVIAADPATDLTVGNGDPTRKLIRQVLGAVAEFEKGVLVAKLAAGRRRARKAGKRVEGVKPFGHYTGEAETLERILELSRKPRGRGMKRRTLQVICETLNTEGRKTRYGAEWRPANLSALLVKMKTGKPRLA